MNVKEIKIQEYKGVENIEAEINGNHILLMGDNGLGKSTIMQFIEIALGKQKNIPPGASGKGQILFDKDGKELLCKVSIKDGKPVLKISGDGISIDNNKGAIASLFGAVDFDIDEFVNLSMTKAGQKKQVEIFKSFLDKDFIDGLSKFEANIANDYETRTEINKDIKKLQGSMALHPLFRLPDSELEKYKPVDTVEVMKQLKDATEHNEKVSKCDTAIETGKNTIKEKMEAIDKLNAEIKAEDEKIKKCLEWKKTNKKVDTTVFEKTISDASETNQKANQAKTLLEDRKKVETYTNEAGELTAKIESSKEAIANAIREMDSPIPGLSFDDETLIYNGIVVHPGSLCTSEIMELGYKMKYVENPDLGILFIPRGESFGLQRFNDLKKFANDNGLQIIMEQVERGKDLKIEIMAKEETVENA